MYDFLLIGPLDVSNKMFWGAFKRTEILLQLLNKLGGNVYLLPTINSNGSAIYKKKSRIVNDRIYLKNPCDVTLYKYSSGEFIPKGIEEIGDRRDLIIVCRYLDGYFLFKKIAARHFPKLFDNAIIVDIDDNPFDLYAGHKWFFKRIWYKMILEKHRLRISGLLFSGFGQDAEFLDYKRMVIPNYIINSNDSTDCHLTCKNSEAAIINILFVGNLKHQPNWLGLIWFMDQVYLKLHTNKYLLTVVGDAWDRQTLIIGSKTNNAVHLRNISESELNDLYLKTDVVIVPILSGAGSCIKTLEAYFKGAKILSTRSGVRGIRDTDLLDKIAVSDSVDFWQGYLNAFKVIQNKSGITYDNNDYNYNKIYEDLVNYLHDIFSINSKL